MFKKNKLINTLLLTGSLPIISSCAIMGANKSIGIANDSINNAESQLVNGKNQTIQNKNYVSYSDDAYFGSDFIENTGGKALPNIFYKQISGGDRVFTNLNDVANTVYKLTKIPTYVNSMGQTGGGGGDIINTTRITQNGGNLIDFLDNIASSTDTSWQYENGKIILSQVVTKTFLVKNIPGDIQVSGNSTNTSGMNGTSSGAPSAISTGSGGGGSGQASTTGGSTSSSTLSQNVTFNLNGDFWQKYETGLKNLLSKVGTYNINGATGSVTITDKPSAMLNISRYIKEQNKLMDQQVNIDVNVISVDTSADDNYGINWNLVLKGTPGSITMAGASGSSTAATSAASVFSPSAVTQAFTFTSAQGALSGSSAIINALSSLTKVSEVTTAAAVTMSSQPVPINFVQQISYLASTQTTVSASGGAGTTQTSLQPGQVNVGFSMNILPVVEGNDMIRMQITVGISNLKAMSTFSSGDPTNGGATIQLPTVNNRTWMQKVKVRSGSVFVTTGFDDGLDKLVEQGVGQSNWWWLGGGYSANKTKTRLIMLVSPNIIKG